MATSPLTLASPKPGATAALTAAMPQVGAKLSASHAKAREVAEDFESVFLNTMFQQMSTGIEGEGPFGGGAGTGVWRSMLTDQYARTFAKNGGIGIADQVYRSLIQQQEAQS